MTTSGQVIIHLDLDCFYCQVEQKRLGIPREVPCAVQQWDGLIAINYAARALGVTRHMRVMQAMQYCPELKCLHVQTLGGENGREGVEGPVNSGLTHPNDRLLQKACLERYRRASAEIIALIRAILPKAPLEKASIDEVFVDVTSLVEKELEEREDHAVSEHAQLDAFAWGSIVEGGPLNPENEYDRRLSVGASIACRIRGAIRDKLDFTSSAGISHTKMVAKVGSARNKPDKQTIIAARGIAGLMEDLPLKKLRNFGGKLGEELKELGATTAGQVAAMPLKQLQHHFGERAKWILDCVTGQHSEPVSARDLSKSMLAAKSFVHTTDMVALERWMGILADELSDRMIYDSQVNQRFPRNLVLSYRQMGQAACRSKSCAMPKGTGPGPTAAMLQEAGMAMLVKCADALPCTHLGLTATEFQDTPGDEQGCITRFFQSRPQAGAAAQGASEEKSRQAGAEAKAPAQVNRIKPKAKPTIERLFKKVSTAPVNTEDTFCLPSSRIDSTKDSSCLEERIVNNASFSNANRALVKPARDATNDETAPGSHTSEEEPIKAANNHQDSVQHTQRHSLPWADHVDSVRADSSDCRRDSGNICGPQHQSAKDEIARPLAARVQPGNHPDMSGSERECKESEKSIQKPQLKTSESGSFKSDRQSSAAISESGQNHDRESAQPGVVDDKAPDGSMDLDMSGIDLEEQNRILREIWLQKALRSKGTVMKRQVNPTQGKAPKQPRLTDMFRRS